MNLTAERRRLTKLDMTIADLTEERDRVAAAIATEEAFSGPWKTMSRMDAVKRVLRSEHPKTPTRVEITRILARRGRTDTANEVSLALSKGAERGVLVKVALAEVGPDRIRYGWTLPAETLQTGD